MMDWTGFASKRPRPTRAECVTPQGVRADGAAGDTPFRTPLHNDGSPTGEQGSPSTIASRPNLAHLDFDEGQLTVRLHAARQTNNAEQVLSAVYDGVTTLNMLCGQLVKKVNELDAKKVHPLRNCLTHSGEVAVKWQ